MKPLTMTMRNVLVRLHEGAQTAAVSSVSLRALKDRGLATVHGLTPYGRSAAEQIIEARRRGNRELSEVEPK